MPRIAALSLDQINRQLDRIDNLVEQVNSLQKRVANVGHQAITSDPIHAPQTTNNLTFTWTGGSSTLSWPAGFLKDKNWNAQVVSSPNFSSVQGPQHFWGVPAGSLVLAPTTYYWLGWDAKHQVMHAAADASTLHSNFNVQIVCQIFTGTGGQTGVAGGGGSTSGVDLSGSRYKNF